MIWTELPTSPATPVVLLLDEPEMSAGYALELTTPARVDKSLAAKEERRVFGRSFRLSTEYTLALDTAAQCSAFRDGLKRLKGELLGVPLWMDQVTLPAASIAGTHTLAGDGTRPIRAGEWYVVFNGDPTAAEIVKVTGWSAANATIAGALEATWPAGSILVPLMFGRFTERPKAEAVTDMHARVPVHLREDSPYALRVNALGTPSIPVLGANVPGHTSAPIWKFAPEGNVRPINSTEADAITKEFGYVREVPRYDYSQPVRRGLEADFTATSRAQIESIELFFRDRRGTTRPFFVPSWLSDLELAADAAIGAGTLQTVVSVYADPAYTGHPGQPYLAVCDPLTDAVDAFKVASVSAGTITLTGTTPRAYRRGDWIVTHLLSARFGTATLRWEYETDQWARTRLNFLEQTDEYLTPSSDEPEPVFLFRFTENLRAPFTPTVWRFTSYEDAFTVDGDGTYTPAPFGFGEFRQSTRLEDEELEIRSWLFAGNPLGRLWPITIEGPLLVELFEADAALPLAEPELLFKGEIAGCEPEGKGVIASAVPWGRTLEQRLPNFRFQGPCNYLVYGTGCGADPTVFRISGTIVSADLDGRRLIINAGGAKPEGYFASGGFLEVLLSGGTKVETRGVLQSEPWASGTQTRLTLTFPLTTAIGSLPGLSARAYPGCDGYPRTCGGTFANYDNYGGHWFVPRENPSIKAIPTKTGGGGKKG